MQKRDGESSFILLYHALDSIDEPSTGKNAADASIVVGQPNFRSQLDYLRQREMTIEPLERLLSAEASSAKGGAVVLTFDDGHRSNYTLAFPALAEVNASAMFYIVAGMVDCNPDYVTSAQLREMAAGGMEIGSHSMTHPFLPQLTTTQIRNELVDSKKRLEDVLGKPVLDLALPGGHGSRLVFRLAEECGYRSVATCRIGVFRPGDNPMRLPRLEVRRGLSIEDFGNTFEPAKLRQLQRLELVKSCLRRSLGLNNYTRLRSAAHRIVSIKR